MDYSDQPKYQTFDIEDGYSKSLGFESTRILFIRKVYLILSFQLAITTLFCLLSYASPTFAMFQVQNIVLFYIFLVLGLVIEIAIMCCKSMARQVPNNYIALASFTFCESWVVSTICSMAYLEYSLNGAELVLAAAVLTLGVTCALTLYAFTTTSDFTMMGGSLFIFGIVVLLIGLLAMLFQSPLLNLIYLGLATILYGYYLIYDTQLIVGGKHNELDIDDYIIAALIIYVDIIQMFLTLLQILLELFGKRS